VIIAVQPPRSDAGGHAIGMIDIQASTRHSTGPRRLAFDLGLCESLTSGATAPTIRP